MSATGLLGEHAVRQTVFADLPTGRRALLWHRACLRHGLVAIRVGSWITVETAVGPAVPVRSQDGIRVRLWGLDVESTRPVDWTDIDSIAAGVAEAVAAVSKART